MATVTFDKAQRWYDGADEPAVPGINLEINDGEFMVLVGPSGCGKSTTLRMLAGLEEVNDGHIYIGDRDVTTMPPKDRDIAMVFQNYALYPHMSVADNMAFALKMAKVPDAEQKARVADAAKILGLEEFLDRKPKALSGGQRQRVAMGRAIVRQPQVFCMDEPLSNLDAKMRVQTRTDIAKLQADLGVTTVYVTHDQVEAMTMGDRVAVMKLGILQQVDTPLNLYDKPANLFVAGFIGSPQMNLMQGQRPPARSGWATTRCRSTRLRRGGRTARLRSEYARRLGVSPPKRRVGCPSTSESSRNWAPTVLSTAPAVSRAPPTTSSCGSPAATRCTRATPCSSPPTPPTYTSSTPRQASDSRNDQMTSMRAPAAHTKQVQVRGREEEPAGSSTNLARGGTKRSNGRRVTQLYDSEASQEISALLARRPELQGVGLASLLDDAARWGA